jgi:hypothetical protein
VVNRQAQSPFELPAKLLLAILFDEAHRHVRVRFFSVRNAVVVWGTVPRQRVNQNDDAHNRGCSDQDMQSPPVPTTTVFDRR